MSDLILGAANCETCGHVIKGYISGDGNELDFAHIASSDNTHRAFPDLDTFQIVTYEVWHAIAVDGT